MSEGDSVGESIHGKPSAVASFFTRLGQVTGLPQRVRLSSDAVNGEMTGK